jgi:hypothetical protein
MYTAIGPFSFQQREHWNSDVGNKMALLAAPNSLQNPGYYQEACVIHTAILIVYEHLDNVWFPWSHGVKQDYMQHPVYEELKRTKNEPLRLARVILAHNPFGGSAFHDKKKTEAEWDPDAIVDGVYAIIDIATRILNLPHYSNIVRVKRA